MMQPVDVNGSCNVYQFSNIHVSLDLRYLLSARLLTAHAPAPNIPSKQPCTAVLHSARFV
jgi:hypothetical protein